MVQLPVLPGESSISISRRATVHPCAAPTPTQSSCNRSITDIAAEISYISFSIHCKKRTLKTLNPLDPVRWSSAADVLEQEIQRILVDREYKEAEFLKEGGTEEEWQVQGDNVDLQARVKALMSKLPLLRDQALDIRGQSQDQASLRSYVTLFTTSVAGLNITKGQSMRQWDTSDQLNFRQSLLDTYDLRGTGAGRYLIWDVVLGDWRPASQMVAAHLVPSRFGSDTMTAIFGKEAENEMFSPKNGLMLSIELEKQFKSGFYAIVPDISEDATAEERKAWRVNPTKDYKVKFIDKPTEDWVPGGKLSKPEPHWYNMYVGKDLLWKDLDGKKLEFRNDQRPRARYLYFVFCLNILRFAWKYEQKAPDMLTPELRRFYWGSPKRYVKGKMLPGLIEGIGHRFKEIFEDPEGEDDSAMREYSEGSDSLLKEAATSSVVMDTVDEERDEHDEDDEDDEDYEEMRHFSIAY